MFHMMEFDGKRKALTLELVCTVMYAYMKNAAW